MANEVKDNELTKGEDMVKAKPTTKKAKKIRIKSLLDSNIVYSDKLTIPPFQSIVLPEKTANELLATKYFIKDIAIGE